MHLGNVSVDSAKYMSSEGKLYQINSNQIVYFRQKGPYKEQKERTQRDRQKYKQTHRHNNIITRMVQLPATAAIEYVAAPGGTFSPGVLCPGALLDRGTFGRGDFWPGVLLSGGSFARGYFWPGGLLAGGIFGRGDFWPGCFCPGGGLLSGGSFARETCPGGAYARSPQVQCVYAPSGLSVPSNVA